MSAPQPASPVGAARTPVSTTRGPTALEPVITGTGVSGSLRPMRSAGA